MILDSNETIAINESDYTDLTIVDEGGVAVDRGRILEVASSQLLERKYSALRRIGANGQVVLPGFVDPHTHLVFQGSREEEFSLRQEGSSYLEILKKGGGIMETVNKTRETSQSELVSVSQKRLDTAIESGTTTLEIKSGYGLQVHDELKILHAIHQLKKQNPCGIATTFLGAHAVPPDFSEREYTQLVVKEMLPIVGRQRLADFCDVFCEDGAFSADSSRAILEAGKRNDLWPKIHADQFTDNGGARVANNVGAMSADHLVHSDLSEVERMRKTSVTPVVLPASSHSTFSKQFAPVREMLAAGLSVALGSDFSPSNWILGPLTVAAIAARELRMKSEEILRAITINAARALGLHRRVGSLSPGKAADIVVLNAPSYKWIGYTYGEGLVDKVLIAGREIVREGRRVS